MSVVVEFNAAASGDAAATLRSSLGVGTDAERFVIAVFEKVVSFEKGGPYDLEEERRSFRNYNSVKLTFCLFCCKLT